MLVFIILPNLIYTVNTTKLSKIINYLNIHPLKTNKSIVYFNIRKIYILIREKKSLTNEDIKLLTKYKNNLNRLENNIKI